ncbi:MAG: hypothetical protein OEV49_07675 [candidate division Zixibacteria bacterium]|nr:hypothetical protein [candidate division Zixibacteria bacterium]MDH3938725.1 hypothetical protein [candidate division Zixibacteria bacterium]MDH4035350.1 hypothetical protein [candidate division Zixibacteria bacterium]
MQARLNATHTLILITVLCLTLSAHSGDLTINAGLGYDLLSQEYFLDNLVPSGADSVLVEWSLTKDYLDDLKGQLWVKYRPFDDNRMELRAGYDQTAEFLRLRLTGDFSKRWHDRKVQVVGRVEVKDRYRGQTEFGDSYLRASARSKFSAPLGSSTSITMQLKGDGVRFQSVSTYNYNHFRIGGSIGLEKLFGDFSFADFKLTVDQRKVPDSLALDYLSLGAEATCLAFYRLGEIDIWAGLTQKNYNQPEHKDDHHRLVFQADHRIRISDRWFSRQLIETELTLYHPDDPINVSYSQTELALLGGIESGPFSVAWGPVFEILNERDNEYTAGEDYTEPGARVVFDYMAPGRLFVSTESTTGRRNLTAESELQSDFTFERLSLIGDLSFNSALRLSLLFSGVWEWHEQSQENSRLYLVSSNLTYEF